MNCNADWIDALTAILNRMNQKRFIRRDVLRTRSLNLRRARIAKSCAIENGREFPVCLNYWSPYR